MQNHDTNTAAVSTIVNALSTGLISVIEHYSAFINGILAVIGRQPLLSEQMKRKQKISQEDLRNEFYVDAAMTLFSLLLGLILVLCGNSGWKVMPIPFFMGIYFSLISGQEIMFFEQAPMKKTTKRPAKKQTL